MAAAAEWAAWSLSGPAAIVDFLGYHSPTHAAQLKYEQSPGYPQPDRYGAVSRIYDVTAGGLLTLTAWVRRYSGACGVAVQVQNPSGAGEWETVRAIAHDAPAPDWTVLAVQVVAAGRLLGVRVITTLGFSDGTFLADDIAVTPDVRGGPMTLLQGYTALIQRLKSLGGAGYWHDLRGENRVICNYFIPGQTGAPEPPYVCVPLFDDGDYPEGAQQGVTEAELLIPITVWVAPADPPMLQSDVDLSCAAECLRWHDDLIKALWGTDGVRCWDLGLSRVRVDLAAKSMRSEVTVEKDVQIGPHVRILVKLTTGFALAELGPSA
ncbi:MAG TPA: hypothetical protein PKK95_09225 [Vicinamibacterales bacterium]|nr:hypothetical protein [Vicinamibacterales bacterium]